MYTMTPNFHTFFVFFFVLLQSKNTFWLNVPKLSHFSEVFFKCDNLGSWPQIVIEISRKFVFLGNVFRYTDFYINSILQSMFGQKFGMSEKIPIEQIFLYKFSIQNNLNICMDLGNSYFELIVDQVYQTLSYENTKYV